MKLCIMHAAIVMILVAAVLFINKIMVVPLRVQFQEAHTKIENLAYELEEKDKKLSDVKAVVIETFQVDDTALLVEYISKHTDNLTKSTINDAADALVKASWANEIPLSLVVGVAQAITGFNTTYKIENSRGIMAVPDWYVRESKQKPVFFNKACNGAEAGCIELSKMLNKYDPISIAIKKYIDAGGNKNSDKVFKWAANFDSFKYKKYRAHLKSCTVPDYSE